VESIAKLFAGKYKELYTSVPYDECELQDIINDLKLSMSDSSVTSDHIFQIKDIKYAVSKLKPHVGEGRMSTSPTSRAAFIVIIIASSRESDLYK